MVLRRRDGILPMSLVDAPRPPEMSLPVITASSGASSTNPWSSAAAGDQRPARLEAAAIESTGVTPRPASRSTSAARCAGPCPSKTSATRQPVAGPARQVVDHPRGLAVVERDRLGATSAIASPRRPGRRRTGRRRRATASSGRRPALRLGQAERRRPSTRAGPASAACARTSARVWKAAAPRSIGACAADGGRGPGRLQELVARCGPGRAPGCGSAPGRRAARGCRPACSRSAAPCESVPCSSAGASDSMPSTGMPSASLSSISASSGCSPASSAARSRTSGVSSSSRHGGAHSRSTWSMVRWSATAKVRISSTSSPQNSTRGRVLVGGREDVQDAAAHGELAALGDQVDPGVGHVGAAAGRHPRVPPRRRWSAPPARGRRGP